jgi:regulator of sirC expression with transglutaminase-like and TPR domain
MKTAGEFELSAGPHEKQREALLKLLADEDLEIYRQVRRKILSYGPGTKYWLQPLLLAPDAVLRRRARDIIRYFDRKAADDSFLAFCLRHGQEFDLEEAVLLLALTAYPEVNPEGYSAILDSHAAVLRARLVGSGPKANIQTLNRYLFGELRFAGDEDNYFDPQNSYFNRVLDRRKGNPINLSLLYILVARRLRLPVAGIGLPGHFLCRYQSSLGDIYVDPFNQGRMLTKADCIHYLQKGHYEIRDDHLAPATPRRMLLRICGNLHQIYLQQDNDAEAERLQRYVVALSR